MASDLLRRRREKFVLWRPGVIDPVPRVVIGTFDAETSTYTEEGVFDLAPEAEHPDLWTFSPFDSQLSLGIKHVFFEVISTCPYNAPMSLRVCLPFAECVDYRCISPSGEPAAVFLLEADKITPCDPDGFPFVAMPPVPGPPNNRLVIYELPTSWTRDSGNEVPRGNFHDVRSLFEKQVAAPDFPEIEVLQYGHSHLADLGINALELLPPADADVHEMWGYGTRNYFAPDFALGSRDGEPHALRQLAGLTDTIRAQGVRFVYDAVMAFCRNTPYRHINFSDFLIHWGAGDPEQGNRDGFGGDLIKYRYETESYDPISGQRMVLSPGRQWMLAHLLQWIEGFGASSLRLDSVNNIDCWDFLKSITEETRNHANLPLDQYLVVGEELSMPPAIVRSGKLDGLWNESFKLRLRKLILGQGFEGQPDSQTIREVIDGRRLPPFTDLAQMVNYVTSHDVGGDVINRRLYDYLQDHGVADKEPRFILAFTTLLTAVGIPMIFAGEEFADQHDLPVDDHSKQVDPVNFARLQDEWRCTLCQQIAELVQLRTTADALSVNDTSFTHWDFTDDRRVVGFIRGREGRDTPIAVLLNFSEATSPGLDYEFQGLPSGTHWTPIGTTPPLGTPLRGWDARVYRG